MNIKLVLMGAVGALALATTALAQTPALDANTKALAAAVKAGDRNKIADLQHQRQAILQAQSKLTGATESTQKFNQAR